jgi:hypothetical protein
MSFSKRLRKIIKSKLRKRIKKGFSKKLKIVPKIKLNVLENPSRKFNRKLLRSNFPEKLMRVERKKELFGP